MKLSIESDREFVDGRTPHPYLKKITLPVQRLVVARYDNCWESFAGFGEASSTAIAPILRTLFDDLGLRAIDPAYEWIELQRNAAQYITSMYLRFSQAYGIEIRSEDVAANICASLIPETEFARFFSNYEVVEQDGKIVGGGLAADHLTDHTFEFSIVIATPETLSLLISWDED